MVDSVEVRGFFVVYERALGLFKQKAYDEAWQLLESYYQQTGAKSLVSELLKSHILWEQKKYVSTIVQLKALLREYATSEDKKRLAGAFSILGGTYARLGQSEKAVESYMKSAQLEPEIPQKLVEISNALFVANAIENLSSDRLQEVYRLYRYYLKKMKIEAYPLPQWQHEKIRIGYLSADLMDHAVGQFVRPFFFDFDRRFFKVYVFQLNKKSDFVTEDLQSAPVYWRNIAGKNFDEIASDIRRDEIDILVELGGHTGNNALPVLAYRAAKIQISGIGYFNSTGISECDGFLSDIYCAPEEYSPYFTEKLLRLPHTHFCYCPYKKFPQVVPPPCLRNGYVTFGSFNNFVKVNDGMLSLWREILAQVPSSRLMLKHQLLSTDEGRDYTIRRLKSLKMPLERIELRSYSVDYLQEYGEIDIALDTSPYPGGLTTCEALYMGVPLVSLCGNRHGARFGESFLRNLGMGELSADCGGKYVAIAVELASDYEFLSILRSRLRQMMQESPLMDRHAYMRDVEELYKNLQEDVVQ